MIAMLQAAAHFAAASSAPGGAAEAPKLLVPNGEGVLFFILAPLMTLSALGLLFAKKAVHAALCMAFVMIGLAIMYAAQGAQFLFAAQIVVYTGAVMMLFLFVLMLVGVDRDDSLRETIRGQRVLTVIAALGLVTILVGSFMGIGNGWFGFETLPPIRYQSLDAANADGNPTGVARIVFSDFVITLELVGMLLIVAAIGAIALTHRERLTDKVTQRTQQQERVRANKFVAGLPAPGVFARHNAVDVPALLPDGSPAEASVSRVLRARGQDRPRADLDKPITNILDELHVSDAVRGTSTHGSEGEK